MLNSFTLTQEIHVFQPKHAACDKAHKHAFFVPPGLVQSGWTCHYSVLFRMLMQVIMWMFFVPCEVGAQTVIYCAVSQEAAKHNGGYFVDCRPAALRPFARDAAVAKKLWEVSERLVKEA